MLRNLQVKYSQFMSHVVNRSKAMLVGRKGVVPTIVASGIIW